MSELIENYLTELKHELSGSDAAIIQDALADAEEHLRNALEFAGGTEKEPDEELIQSIISKYGSPQEIAQAYREIEAYTKPVLVERRMGEKKSSIQRFVGVLADSHAWGALLYLTLSGITGVLYFTWAVSGLAISLGMMLLVIGLPFTALFLLSVRSIALMEGRMVEALLGVRMPRRPVFTNREAGRWEQVKVMMLEKRTWLAVLYMILQAPLGILYFGLFFTLISSAVLFIASPVLELVITEPIIRLGPDVFYYLQGWQMVLLVVAGFLLLLGSMHLAKLLGRWHGALARGLLVGTL
ncbi:MAG: sensor domain-containing protein [Anaerolineales bacterium]|nr:sensor domain-containing protein [Anaerolineales bacterium]